MNSSNRTFSPHISFTVVVRKDLHSRKLDNNDLKKLTILYYQQE